MNSQNPDVSSEHETLLEPEIVCVTPSIEMAGTVSRCNPDKLDCGPNSPECSPRISCRPTHPYLA